MWPFVSGFFHLNCFSRFIHVVACISTPFLSMAEYSIVWLYHILFIHSMMSCFHFLAIMTNNVMNTMYKFLCEPVYNSFGYIPRRELLGHMVILSLTYWGTAKVFPTVAIPFYILTTSLSTAVTAHFFDYWYPSECEMVSYCGFDLHFLMSLVIIYVIYFL